MYLRMIFQHHDVPWHESLVKPFRHADGLLCGEVIRICYDAQHVFLVKVEIPYHAIYGSPVRRGIQFYKLHLVVNDRLLCEGAWW
tara:strand:- start:362 stop:616 length:255 start_codon:yes stop_codon:yes gene_type:complete